MKSIFRIQGYSFITIYIILKEILTVKLENETNSFKRLDYLLCSILGMQGGT